MKTRFGKILMTLTALAMAFSCGKTNSEPVEPETNPEAPAFYKKIVKAGKAGLTISSLKQEQSKTTFTFSDESLVMVPDADLTIEDCTSKDPENVSLKDGFHWFIGDHQTTLVYDSESSLLEAYPVYAYFNKTEFVMYTTTDNTVKIQIKGETPGPGPTPQEDSLVVVDKNGEKVVEPISMKAAGNTKYVVVKSSKPWTATSSKKWTTLDVASAEGGLETKVNITTSENTKTEVRTAEVTFTDGTLSVVVTISQKAADSPTPGPAIDDDEEEKIDATIAELAAKAFPEIYINTDGRSVTSKEVYVENCTITFKDPDGRYTTIAENGGAMKIKGRGNTTWNYEKKPWRIKLDKKTRVFGMPLSKNWAMLANYTDKTLLRNSVAFEISRLLGMSWTPKSRACHVYMNDTYNKEYQYKGLYFITENKDVASAKVNIDPIDPASGETDGDYYFEIDSDRNETTVFVTKYLPVMLIEPEVPSDAQLKYVKEVFATAESALDSGNGFDQYLDIKSFMNNFIVQELCKNIDGCMRKSTFMVKHKGGKLEMYHVWDFDIALGNANFFTSDFGIPNDYTQWFVRDFCWNIRKDEYGQSECLKNQGWYWDMFQNASFKAQFKAYWQSVYPLLQTIPTYIDNQVTLIQEAQKKEQDKWHLVGRKVWPNVNNSSTYQGEIDYLKNFYTNRLKWLNDEISKF